MPNSHDMRPIKYSQMGRGAQRAEEATKKDTCQADITPFLFHAVKILALATVFARRFPQSVSLVDLKKLAHKGSTVFHCWHIDEATLNIVCIQFITACKVTKSYSSLGNNYSIGPGQHSRSAMRKQPACICKAFFFPMNDPSTDPSIRTYVSQSVPPPSLPSVSHFSSVAAAATPEALPLWLRP